MKVCPGYMHETCEQHLAQGLRHPTSIGDLIGSVADGIEVFDNDGDLVVDAHRGPRFIDYRNATWPLSAERAQQMRDALINDEYAATTGERYSRERIVYTYHPKLADPAFRESGRHIWWDTDPSGHLKETDTDGEVTSFGWLIWLISDSFLTAAEMTEVRKSLGLEE